MLEPIGKVILAGAGSGDPELITLKALKYIQTADVILTDRLVSPELINTYAPATTEIIYVGKQCSKGVHTPQQHINNLILQFAQQGKLVLRLKGGDASLFSNILDELQILVQNNIPYEIIPGVSAAFGAAAYTGIPLTARGFSRGVRFLTLYELSNIDENQWQDWAKTEDTLVFYMSGQKLDILMQKLEEQKIDSNKKIAVVQQATTPEQKTQIFSFYRQNNQNNNKNQNNNELLNFNGVPTLLIIGKVVQLHESFSWFQEKELTNQPINSYFDNRAN